MKVSINKDLLFKLITSHSKLTQAEYDRNPEYNKEHFSHKVEIAVIEELLRLHLYDEFFIYTDENSLEGEDNE